MTFMIKERTATTIQGQATNVVVPKGPADFAQMSAQKQVALDQQPKAQQAVNYNQNGEQHYLVAGTTGSGSFTLPAGTYAQFTLTVASRVEADQKIGQAYGELAQSTAYQVAGNFNLEEFAASQLILWLPVQAK